MRRLADLQERYGRDTPEEEFLLAASDAGARVVPDRAKDAYVLVFDDEEAAEDFKKEYLDFDGVRVRRTDHEGGDRFVIEVDKETALQAFTPDPDDYARESVIDERTMTPAMQRTLDKVAAELASRVGEKVAKEMIQKYVASGDDKGKGA